jgi:hypothetical protein
MRQAFLALCLLVSSGLYAGPDINRETYPSLDEAAKEKAASKQDFLWSLNGIAKPTKLFAGDHAIKRIGIMSSMLNAGVEQKSYKYDKDHMADGSYTEVTVYSYQSYSPAMMQAFSNKFHDQFVEALARYGYEVTPAATIAKAPGMGELQEEFKDKDLSNQVAWYVPSKGSIKIGPLAGAAMSQRKEWMGKLIKDTNQQMLVHVVNSVAMVQGKKEELEGVKGMWIEVSMQMFGNYWTSKDYLIEAATANGLFNKWWNMISNGGAIVNYSKLMKTRIFLPMEPIADAALNKKIQDEYFYRPLIETQAVLADLNARGFKQVLAKD